MKIFSGEKLCVSSVFAFLLSASVQTALGVTNYVVPVNAGASPPYTNWTTAATNIEAAVAAATNGNLVLVTNGTYTITNQVVITNEITLRSVNGPTNTFVNGGYPTITNRCFWISNALAVIDGFTITNGYVVDGNGGGIYIATNATITNCTIANNTAGGGGGVYSYYPCTLQNCTISGNTATNNGGGVYLLADAMLTNCTILANTATNFGGGVFATNGGLLRNCSIVSNIALVSGGGIYMATNGVVQDCVISGNSAAGGGAGGGGGVYGEIGITLQNCTIVTNTAENGYGGGVYCKTDSTVTNCIVYFNTASSSDNHTNIAGVWGYTCTTPTNDLTGSGNITNDPGFVDFTSGNYRLSSVSPCIDVGSTNVPFGVDLNGRAHNDINGSGTNEPDMGCYEFYWAVPELSTPVMTNMVMKETIGTNTVRIWFTNSWDGPMYYQITNSAAWVTSSVSTGLVAFGSTNSVLITNSAVGKSVGSYTGSVTFTTVNSTNGTVSSAPVTNLQVVMKITDMTRSPTSLTNTVVQGGATSNTFDVVNAGYGDMTYTISTNASWMTVSNSTGTCTGQTVNATNTHTVTYDSTGLSLGLHSGTITIAADAGGSPLTIGVALTVVSQPELNVSPGILGYTIMSGQNLTNRPDMTIWNSSDLYTLGYEVSESINWLSVSSNSGSIGPNSTNMLTVQFATSNLTAGLVVTTYTGSITFTGTNTATGDSALGSPQSVNVTVTVNPRPQLCVSPTVLTNSVMQAYDASTQRFEVWDGTGFYTLQYSITDDVPWLITSVLSGTSTGEHDTVEVLYSTTSLQVGTSNATITIRGTDLTFGYTATSSPQTVSITLQINPVAVLSCDAVGFTNDIRQGDSVTSRTFKVWNGCADPQSVLSYTITNDVDWLSVNPASKTNVPGQTDTITLSYNTTGMGPGVHRGTIVVRGVDVGTGYDAIASPKEIAVELSVTETKPLDFSGDGVAEVVVYHESSGMWYVLNLDGQEAWYERFGGSGYEPAPGDYDGDGATELGVYKTSSGYWYSRPLEGYSILVVGQFGGTGYEPVRGDFDGDGRQDFALYSEGAGGKWYVMSPDAEVIAWDFQWGGSGFSPLAADFDGDGRDDMAVYEDSTGKWYIISTDGTLITWEFAWGGSGFTPLAGDYDGDGTADLAAYHTDTGWWFITSLTDSLIAWALPWGGYGFTPLAGDYNGDGVIDLAVYYQGLWYIETVGGTQIQYGLLWGGVGYVPIGM